jgi:GLPGLI family protein
MKFSFLVLSLCISFVSFSQPKLISQAIVNTTTTVIAPEDEDVQNLQNSGQGGGMNFRNFMDGETKSVTYLKNNFTKTVMKSDMGRSTIIRNDSLKLTTTLIEMMGNKTGFYVTDEEQAQLRKRADSMMQGRRKKDSSASITREMPQRPSEVPVEISYTNDTRKIAGYACKKAWVITTRLLGTKDSVAAWYSPEIKLQHVSSTGGLSGFGNMGSVNGLDKIDGFVMAYEMNMRRNRKMQVEVTKIDLQKDIADKEFDIPKDFEVKPMKDMQNMFGGQGGFQMRRGNQ